MAEYPATPGQQGAPPRNTERAEEITDLVIGQLKSVARLEPIHITQVLTYLKRSGCSVGRLLNFNVELMKDGIRRLVNNYPDSERVPHSARVPRR